MKAFLIFSGSAPLLILTSYPDVKNGRFVDKLKHKGIKKFIAFEVPLDHAKQRYGARFDVISADLAKSEDMRVLDYDGHIAFNNFSFDELGEMVKFEEKRRAK